MQRKTPFVRVQNLRNQALIADKCFVAVRFFDRLRGLIGKKTFPLGEAMLFPVCNDIHMWFMSIPIDVIFLRRGNAKNLWLVTSVHVSVPPWKILPLRDGQGEQTLELPVGAIEKAAVQPGDELCID